MEIKSIFLLTIVILLISCSSNSSLTDKAKIYKKFYEVSQENPLKIFNRKELDYIKYPLIEIRTTGILKQALMLPLSRRDSYINYWSGSGQTITMNGFVISKTNGINVDLLSVELNKDSPLLYEIQPKFWPSKGTRKHLYLSHLNEIKGSNFECSFSIKEEAVKEFSKIFL